MSNKQPGSKALDRLVRESRQHLGTREAGALDWDRVERGLFARIESEQARERSEMIAARSRHRVAWGAGAAALAVAAAVALVVGKTRGPSLNEGAAHATASDDAAGAVASIGQDATVMVSGKPAAIGAPLSLGDDVDARGGRVTFDRPGKVSWILESGSRTTVTHVQGALVLALQAGTVEAQVVPVASGEAFAVDVDGARIAVHGTHLRVARVMDHVTIDLTEGVISLGEAPRVGSTIGTLITAPAHAEFTSTDLKGSLTVTHDRPRDPTRAGHRHRRRRGAGRPSSPSVPRRRTQRPTRRSKRARRLRLRRTPPRRPPSRLRSCLPRIQTPPTRSRPSCGPASPTARARRT